MLGLLGHIVLWVLAGIGILTVIFVATSWWWEEPSAAARPTPPPVDPDRVWQWFPEDHEATEYDATVRQLRRLERDAMRRLDDLRTGRP